MMASRRQGWPCSAEEDAGCTPAAEERCQFTSIVSEKEKAARAGIATEMFTWKAQ